MSPTSGADENSGMYRTDAIPVGRPVFHPTAFVAPGVIIYGDATLRANSVIMFGVVIRAEFGPVEVGCYSNIQDGVVMHVDEGFPCTVGAHSTVGHSAVLHGTTIGDRCLVGIGARALNGSELGEGAWLASGAVLPEGRKIPPWTLALGIPAKPVRELTEAEIERQRHGVESYQRLATTYRQLLESPD